MRRILVLALVFGFASVASAQTPIIIDDFTDIPQGQSNFQANSGNFTVGFNHTTTGAIGGNRQGSVTWVSGGGNSELDFDGSDLSFNNGAGTLGDFAIGWGFAGDLNLDITTNGLNAIAFDRDFLDLNASYIIQIESDFGGANPQTATFAGNLGGGGGPSQTIEILLSSFANGNNLDLTDIDRVQFQFFSLQQSTNFTVDNFRFTAAAVPEPTTWALIGLVGAGAVGYRRYQKRRKELDAAMTN